MIAPRWTRALLREEDGQTLVVVVVMIITLTALVGLAVDIGDVYLSHRQLQASTDAAALAGAAAIPISVSSSQVQNAAIAASSVPGGANTYNNLTNVQMVAGYPLLKCLASLQKQGVSCVGNLQYNAVQVVQQATVPLYFSRVIGKKTMNISVAATAAKGGGSSKPYNIALVLDTTLSMNSQDANCGNTQMTCTLNGARQLLSLLDPCGTSQTACTIVSGNSVNPVVRVSIFSFPSVQTNTINYSQCNSSLPTAQPYNFPIAGATIYTPGSSTYQLIGFQSDYRLSDTATSLNPNSTLAMSMGGVAGCAGLQPPTNAGYYGTYYAGTIYAAQSALRRQQAIYPDAQNVMIIIGDGDQNAPHCNPQISNPAPAVCTQGVSPMPLPATALGYYPSYYGECGQAVTATNFATTQGTRVYSVAYGSPQSGCIYDATGYNHPVGAYPDISPCNEMAALASASYYFFSDFQQSGSNSTCVAAQTVVSLNDIFLQIAQDLTVARLLPDGTT